MLNDNIGLEPQKHAGGEVKDEFEKLKVKLPRWKYCRSPGQVNDREKKETAANLIHLSAPSHDVQCP